MERLTKREDDSITYNENESLSVVNIAIAAHRVQEIAKQ